MQDHPTIDELLGAVAGFLRDDVMPATQGRINFHARVSANVLEIIRRELQHQEEHADSEWRGLDAVLGPAPRPASFDATRRALESRNADLSARIRNGFADDEPRRSAVLAHLRSVVVKKLVVDTPALVSKA